MNINDEVWVKLNDHGREIAKKEWDDLVAENPKVTLKYRHPFEDEEGWSRWQLWNLMQTFGSHLVMGRIPPFDTEIRTKEDMDG